jgi:hypothetical protein
MMSEFDDEPQRIWRPHAPTPYVTHQDIAPLHRRVGMLEKGHQSLESYLAGMRAEMLTQFERVEKLLREQQQAPQGGVNLSMREIVVFVVALVLAGAVLGRIMGVERLLGG